MSVRNLDKLLRPRALALLGVDEPDRPAVRRLLDNIAAGGFAGPVMPLSETRTTLAGWPCFARAAELSHNPDLAIAVAPGPDLPAQVRELAARGLRALVLLGDWPESPGRQGGRLDALLEAGRPFDLRVVGPESLGVLVPGQGLNASTAHVAPRPGDLAFVSQSRAMTAALLDWAANQGVGFSTVISLGRAADVDVGDLLDHLALDAATRAILIYVEDLSAARKFMSAARFAARTKPVLVIRGGRHRSGGPEPDAADAAYDAAFARAGLLRVHSLEELFDAAETMALVAEAFRTGGDRLAVLSNGRGPALLACDAVWRQGGRLAELEPATRERLAPLFAGGVGSGNPVMLAPDADASAYRGGLEALLADRACDALVVINTPGGLASPEPIAAEVAELLSAQPRRRRRPVMLSWLGGAAAGAARRLFVERGLPSYPTPERAVRACLHLARYSRNQAKLIETPPALPRDFTPDRTAARAVIEAALAGGQAWLDEAQSMALLAAYRIPVAETHTATEPEAAAAAAAALGGPVALKLLSPDVAYKSAVGGVVLDLAGPEEVSRAAEAMGARLEGFLVQAMCDTAGRRELMLGVLSDPVFGPLLAFGDGGTAAELIADRALALPPLNMSLAHALIEETRVARLLGGYRGYAAADLDALALTLCKLSQLVVDCPELLEGEINPLLAGPDGVLVLDARLRIAPAARSGTARLAIRPYPQQLEGRLELLDGRKVSLRPLRPEDAPLLQSLFRALDPDDVRLRFFAPIKEMSDQMAARLSQIDYDREMALVALDPSDPVSEALGIVRISADADNRRAEFAVLVRSDLKGEGLGRALMRAILDYARGRGIREVWAEVLAENRAMLGLAEDLGFSRHRIRDDFGTVEVVKRFDDVDGGGGNAEEEGGQSPSRGTSRA